LRALERLPDGLLASGLLLLALWQTRIKNIPETLPGA